AIVGAQYSYAFAATGTPAPTYSLASGSLPAGLKLNATTGVLSGKPKTAGASTFAVRASNGVDPAAVTPTLEIDATVAAAPVFTAASPPAAAWDAPYSYAFTATGNPAPTYTIASGSLPAGLSLDPSTGVLSGTPTAIKTSTFTLKAANGIAPAAKTASLKLTVAPPPPGTVLSWGDDS